MLTDDVIREANHLLTCLRNLRAEEAIPEAELLLTALKHEPVSNVLDFAKDAVERIDTYLSEDPLSEWAIDRLTTVASMIEALDAAEEYSWPETG